jgi:hypothetical protein
MMTMFHLVDAATRNGLVLGDTLALTGSTIHGGIDVAPDGLSGSMY